MKNLTLVIIIDDSDPDRVGYTAYYKEIPGIVVQTDKIEDIPKEIGTSMRVMTNYLINKKEYKLWDGEHYSQ